MEIVRRRACAGSTLAMSEEMWCCQDVQVMLGGQDCGCPSFAALCSACPVCLPLFTRSLLQVQRHLSKLFDNLAKLKFQVDSEQKTSKIGLGMYSREEEYVQFSEPCDCSGQVRGEPLAVPTPGGTCPHTPRVAPLARLLWSSTALPR